MATRRRVRVPLPVAALGRALGVPFAEVRQYWRQESRSIRSGSSALSIGLVATLIAGVVLGAAEGQLAAVPGLLALIPAAIGMRGSIFGALGSRLATGIHTGQFTPELSRRTFLGRQLEAAALLSVTSATQAGVLAWAVSVALGLRAVGLLELVGVSLVGGLLSSLVLFFVTVAMARRSHHRGWNMDDVGAPIITATGDLVTLPALLLASLLLRWPGVALAVGATGLAVSAVLLVLGWRHSEPMIRRIVRESVVVLTIAVTVDVIAGVVVESRAEQQFGLAAMLLLLPAFIAACGSLGGMLSSRLASQLHVGLLAPRALPGRVALLDFSLTGLLAMLAFTGVGAMGWVAASLVPTVQAAGLATTIGVTVVGGLLATPVLSLAAYAAAATSFRFGFDPDNHGIPIVTATMDLAGVLCLVAAITLLQVG